MGIIDNKNLIDYIRNVKSMSESDRDRHLSTYHPEWAINTILKDYYSHEVILYDGEVLKLIEDHRVGSIPREGLLSLDPIEISILMKAWKSQQYHRFMCHVLDRYINPKNSCKIRPLISNEDTIQCGICWRDLIGLKEGQNASDTRSLAFTSDNTRTTICESCLANLFRFSTIMFLLDDKEFIKLMS